MKEATMPYTVTIKHVLTDEFLDDVLVNCVESTHHYWGFPCHVNRRDDLMVIDFEMELQEGYEHNDLVGGDTFRFDREVVGKAIDVLLKGMPMNDFLANLFARAVRDNDGGDMDSDLCDLVMQQAWFDELVFG
jgi:hypothetical protein